MRARRRQDRPLAAGARAAAAARRRASSARFLRIAAIRSRSGSGSAAWPGRPAWPSRPPAAASWRAAPTSLATCASAASACASSPCLRSRFSAAALRCSATSALAVLDLLLLHGEQDLGRLEPVEDRRLLVDDVLHRVQLAGELGGVLGGEHHGEPHQRRVALLVVATTIWPSVVLLLGDFCRPGVEVRARLLEPGDGGVELGLHLPVERLGRGELAAGLGEVRLRARRAGPRAAASAAAAAGAARSTPRGRRAAPSICCSTLCFLSLRSSPRPAADDGDTEQQAAAARARHQRGDGWCGGSDEPQVCLRCVSGKRRFDGNAAEVTL